MDQFDAAFAVFLQEVGHRLHVFMETPGRRERAVPPEVLEDATRTIMRVMLASSESPEDLDPGALDDPEAVREVQREFMAQAFEEMWEKVISPTLETPQKRAEMILWLEAQAGRPLELTSS